MYWGYILGHISVIFKVTFAYMLGVFRLRSSRSRRPIKLFGFNFAVFFLCCCPLGWSLVSRSWWRTSIPRKWVARELISPASSFVYVFLRSQVPAAYSPRDTGKIYRHTASHPVEISNRSFPYSSEQWCPVDGRVDKNTRNVLVLVPHSSSIVRTHRSGMRESSILLPDVAETGDKCRGDASLRRSVNYF